MLNKEFFQEKRKIYFCGIGGIGVSALARYFNFSGHEVLGSDLADSVIVQDLIQEGISVNLDQKAKNIDKSVDLLIYSSAVPETNAERAAMLKLEKPQYSYNEVLGWLSQQKYTIGISGTNGKTTTTAMTALLMETAGLDPLALVGSKVPQWSSNLRFSQSDYFVVEACEYKAHMLELSPKMIVLTNLAEDHLDFYKDIDDIVEHFQKYIDSLPDDGTLIYNADDENLQRLNWQDRDYRVLTYGIDNEDADIKIDKYNLDPGTQDFWVTYHDKKIMRIKLHVPGIYNVYNALAAITVAFALDLDKAGIKEGIARFTGTWRRFELLQEKDEVTYVADYAHHPEAIEGTLEAARQFYPGRRIVTVFQPHQHNRTKNLFDGFVEALKGSDLAIISEIYDVKGREEQGDQDVSSQDLVAEIQKEKENCLYGGDLKQTLKLIKKNVQLGDLVILMGAGDIDSLRDEI